MAIHAVPGGSRDAYALAERLEGCDEIDVGEGRVIDRVLRRAHDTSDRAHSRLEVTALQGQEVRHESPDLFELHRLGRSGAGRRCVGTASTPMNGWTHRGSWGP